MGRGVGSTGGPLSAVIVCRALVDLVSRLSRPAPWLVALLANVSLACTSDSSEPYDDLSSAPASVNPEELFSMGHLVEVQIELDPLDWESLRHQGRDLIGVYTGTQREYDYDYFEATVTIDGVRHERAGLRKKGFWGSLSVERPSLKIDIDRSDPGASHFGVDKFTLNNGFADPSRSNECLSYQLFASAGLPASRCNLAHVVVNGQDLGTYSNVESIDKQMLARHFSDDDGNLYEGQLVDFEPADVDALELKTNEKKNDRSDVERLVTALEASNEQLLEQLGAIVDIGRFRDFWAMEMIAGHWDGYSNNANNYMAYRDPETGLFSFMPWGTDNAFERPRSRTIYGRGRIAERLYGLPAERARFLARTLELAEQIWDVPWLTAHLDQVAISAPDAVPELLEEQRQFVSGRLEQLRGIVGGKPPPIRRSASSSCAGTVGDISGHFATTFDPTTTPLSPAAEFQVQLSLDGAAVSGVEWTGSAGFQSRPSGPVPAVRYTGTLPDERELELIVYVGPSLFEPGTHEFHGAETYGTITVQGGSGDGFVGNVGSGTLDLVEAGTAPDAPVRGSFSGRIYQFGCAG